MGNYKILKVQLPIVGFKKGSGIAGHNFIAMMNENGEIVGELHGLATNKECNLADEPAVEPIGYLPSVRLKFHELELVPSEYFYQPHFPQQTVFEGTKEEVRAKWEMAVGAGYAINRQDLRYPLLGVIDIVETPLNGPENSNSVASTLLQTMGLHDPDLGWRLTPGEGKQLLTEEELKSIRDNPNQNPYNPVCIPQRQVQSSQEFISQGFAALLSDSPRQGINQM